MGLSSKLGPVRSPKYKSLNTDNTNGSIGFFLTCNNLLACITLLTIKTHFNAAFLTPVS